MNLTINVDALDKTDSAVVSTSDRTPVSALESLTVGNVEPFIVSFCDDTGAVPSWVTDAGTDVSIGLGAQTVSGTSSYTSASLTISGSTRVGSLDLGTTALFSASGSWVCCCHCGQSGFWLTLEVRRVTTVASVITAAESVALLHVFLALPVLSPA